MTVDQALFDSLKKNLDALVGSLECSQLFMQCRDELTELYGEEAFKRRIVSWKETLLEQKTSAPDKKLLDIAVCAASHLKSAGYEEGVRWVLAAAADIQLDRKASETRAAT